MLTPGKIQVLSWQDSSTSGRVLCCSVKVGLWRIPFLRGLWLPENCFMPFRNCQLRVSSKLHYFVGSCSFDDLKAGLAYLKRKRGTQHEGPLAFVKANLTTFMDCQDTLAGTECVVLRLFLNCSKEDELPQNLQTLWVRCPPLRDKPPWMSSPPGVKFPVDVKPHP